MEDEDQLLAWLERRLARAGEPPLIGDDAALLAAGGPWAVTTDTQVAGSHFVADLDPALIARRLLAVNLSDLAAMGARPVYAFLVISAPHGFDHRRFFEAFLLACEPHGLKLAGGDLGRQVNLTLVLTLLGEPAHGARGPSPRGAQEPRVGRWLRRRGAHPGHRLWLGGTVGESALGCELIRRGARPVGPYDGTLGSGPPPIALPAELALPTTLTETARRALWRHLEPRPQLALGRWLASRDQGATLDVSDGLARDLHRLCRASQVGAVVEGQALPLAEGFPELCQHLGLDPLALALGGGEDYVLLFTLPPEDTPPPTFGAHTIGSITQAEVVLSQNGARSPLPPVGWDHLA